MSEEKSLIDQFLLWIPALMGGFVDYLNQIQRGEKVFSLFGFAVHLISAAFFGWATGMAAAGFEYDSNLVAVAGGFGGFLGVRLADLGMFWARKKAGQ